MIVKVRKSGPQRKKPYNTAVHYTYSKKLISRGCAGERGKNQITPTGSGSVHPSHNRQILKARRRGSAEEEESAGEGRRPALRAKLFQCYPRPCLPWKNRQYTTPRSAGHYNTAANSPSEWFPTAVPLTRPFLHTRIGNPGWKRQRERERERAPALPLLTLRSRSPTRARNPGRDNFE